MCCDTHSVSPAMRNTTISDKHRCWKNDFSFSGHNISYMDMECDTELYKEYLRKNSLGFSTTCTILSKAECGLRAPQSLTAVLNPLTAKLFSLNFHPLEAVSRWRDPQLQVSENHSDLTKWRSTLFKSCWLMSHFIFTICGANKKWKPEYMRHRRLKG